MSDQQPCKRTLNASAHAPLCLAFYRKVADQVLMEANSEASAGNADAGRAGSGVGLSASAQEGIGGP